MRSVFSLLGAVCCLVLVASCWAAPLKDEHPIADLETLQRSQATAQAAILKALRSQLSGDLSELVVTNPVPAPAAEAAGADPRGDQPQVISRGIINCSVFGDVDSVQVVSPLFGETYLIFVIQAQQLLGGSLLDPVVSITDVFNNQLFFTNGAPVSNDDMGAFTTGALSADGWSFLSTPFGVSYLTADFRDSGLAFIYNSTNPFRIRVRGFSNASCGYFLLWILTI